MEYRILEHLGKFTVEVKEEEMVSCGWLWWRKKEVVTSWVRSAENGRPVIHFRGFSPSPPLQRFKTLEEAQAMVKVFQQNPIYHYCQPIVLKR